MKCALFIILPMLLGNLVFLKAQVAPAACKKKQDPTCPPRRGITYCRNSKNKLRCPLSCGLCGSSCTKKEDTICPTKDPKIYCSYSIYRFQCPRTCGLCVTKSKKVPTHLATVEEARSAMSEVVQDIMKNSTGTLKTNNINQVNEVMYQIERSIGQASLSRKTYKLPVLKNDIKEAVKLGNVKFARRTLGIALNTIAKSSSGTTRRRRSTVVDGKKFLEDLRKELSEDDFSKLFALEGGKTLMFAIDITGSMNEEIKAAKSIATEISTYKRKSPPSDYILSYFGDPVEMNGVVTKEKGELDDFIKEIDGLIAYGGLDCPEYSIEGMLAALQLVPEYGSPLFVFTDASAKDGTEENIAMLLAMAEETGSPIHFFTAEYCENPPASTFKQYQEIAEETGGNYLRIKEEELSKMAQFTNTNLDSLATVTAGDTKGQTRKRRSTVDEISIPVDNTISKLVVPVTTDNTAIGISLLTPSGTAVTTQVDGLANTAVYIVDSPSVGIWTLKVPEGAGDYQYTVKAASDENIQFNVRYTKNVNRKTLELKYPLAGEKAQVELTISGAKQIKKDSIHVDIVDVSGKVLIADIKPTRDDVNGLRYALTFTPPSEKYKLKIKGKTKEDKEFHRVSQHANEMKSMVLKEFYNSGRYSIKRGGRAYIMLYLFNGKNTDQTFTISFRDTLDYKVSLLGRAKNTVRANSKKFLRVSVRYTSGQSKLGKAGQTENVFILVKGSDGSSATEIVQLYVKE